MAANASDPDVVIVGGAVAGSALANALGCAGVRTLLIEKVSREVFSTRGDLLHPPTLGILDRWGVLATLREDGALPIQELAVTHARRGLIARFDIPGQTEGPAGRTLAVPHDRIEAVLYACACRWPAVQSLRGSVSGLVRDDSSRVVGVRLKSRGSDGREVIRARLVVGCDGSQSLVRRTLGIVTEQHPYDHEQVIVGGFGECELPAALHWYIDEAGALSVINRPRGGFRILLTFQLGQRGDLLKQPDPALHDYVVSRFPQLEPLRFGKADAYVYRLARHVAPCFYESGAAILGDAAHATHPAGATGMSLAIAGAARLAELVAPALLAGASTARLDAALAAYDAERRPAAEIAVAANHAQALRLWQSDVFRDPDAYAQVVNPAADWGAGGAGWGQNPARLSSTAS